jgi:putative nucleotidyltransferase with HDIG domain
MDRSERAKQFMPFDAVKGLREALAAKEEELEMPGGISKNKVCEFFKKYTSKYNPNDIKIKLKIEHTYRVADLCEEIARGLGLQDDDVKLAWLIGMLHDIGRFEQIKKYNTFIDAESVDHASLGVDLLFKDGLLYEFIDRDSVSNENLNIIEYAIRDHSKYRISSNLSEKETMFANILRDADKIDIFKVCVDTPLEEIYNVSTESLKKSYVSEEVKQCFYEKHAVQRCLKKTSIDHLVGHVCLIFELVYPISRKVTFQQGYFQKMLEFESENFETMEWFEFMKKELKKER